MKLSEDYKTRFKILAFLLSFLLGTPFFFVFGQTISELNNKISQKNNEIVKLEQEINTYQKELENLGKQKSSLNTSIQQLDITRKKLVADIAVTQNKIEKTNLRIQELSIEISNKEEVISTNIEAVSTSLRDISELEGRGIVSIMLSDDDFASVWNDIDNLKAVNDRVKNSTIALREVKSNLEDTREETTEAKNELVILRSKLADQKKIIEQNTKEKKNLLRETKNSEIEYQKLVKDRLVKKNAFEKELREYESQLRYILDPSKLPEKGVLSWPLDYIYVTQFFGKTEAGKRLYASGSHNGVDFRAPIGTSVRAMADGVVAGTGDTDRQCPLVSFGRFILLKYDNGLASTYGHLSLIKTNVGDRVKRGQIVGYSGNTGYSTGPHLHVSLYAKDAVNIKTLPSRSCPGSMLTQPISPINAYLDPMYYLPRLQ